MSGENTAALTAAGAAPPPEAEPTHSFESVDDAVAELGKVREEAAGYRTKYAPFRDAFDGLPDNAIELVLEAVVGLKSDSTEGVHAWLDLGQRMAKEDEFSAWIEGTGAAPAAAPVEDPEAEPQEDPVTEPVDIQATIDAAVTKALEADRAARAEADQQTALDNRAAELQKQAVDLGYTPGTDPYRALFDKAVHDQTDLETAHVGLRESFGLPVEDPEPEPDPIAADPPPVPATGAVVPQGGVQTPETAEKLSASDKLAARLDRELEGLPG